MYLKVWLGALIGGLVMALTAGRPDYPDEQRLLFFLGTVLGWSVMIGTVLTVSVWAYRSSRK